MQNAVILQLINQRVFDFCKKHMIGIKNIMRIHIVMCSREWQE